MNAKKLLPLLSLAFLLSATPSFAHQDQNSISTQDSCSQEVENHGQYVSCVAHLHEGGQSVSLAAKSDIGKDRDDEDDDDFILPSDSPLPSESPSPTPDASPSASPSPLTTGTQINADTAGIVGQVIESLQNLIAQLQKLILE